MSEITELKKGDITKPKRLLDKLINQLSAGAGGVLGAKMLSFLKANLSVNSDVANVLTMFLGHFGSGMVKQKQLSAALMGLGVSADIKAFERVWDIILSKTQNIIPSGAKAPIDAINASIGNSDEDIY